MGATAAIAGLGITEMGKVYGRTASDFAGDAIALALEDAGLEARDVDGLLDQRQPVRARWRRTLQFSLGFVDLTLLSAMSAFGSTAGTMLQYAAHAIESGQANVVVCVYADAPLTEGASISQSAYGGKRFSAPGLRRAALRLRRLRARQLDVRAGPAAAHASVRHGPRPARDDRGRPARVGADEPARADAQADDDRRLPRLALGRGAAAPVRLLPGLQRRRRGDRHVGASGRGTCASRRSTCAASGSARRATPRGPSASRRSTPAPPSPGSWRCGRRGSSSRTSTSSSSTTATPTPSSSPSRTTGSARRARAARSSPTASSAPGARCRATRAAASSPRTTCGASRRCRRA